MATLGCGGGGEGETEHWSEIGSLACQVMPHTFLPVLSLCSSMLEAMKLVVNSVSAAVPAPQHLGGHQIE